MARRSVERLRNIGIVAHINAGKTTLTERFLFRSGKQSYMGEVGEGTATMDFMPEEQERGISISAAVSNIDWRGFHINLIDTPGHVDFTVEVERSLLVLDGVIVVLDGVAGVESQTEIVWRQAQQRSVPALVFINKLDRTTADFEASLISISDRLGCRTVPLVLPCRKDGALVGLIDLVEDRLIGSAKVAPETWQPSRQVVIEACADYDETILEDFVDGQGVQPERLHRALRRAVLANRFVPVLAGSALHNRGIDWLMTSVCRYLPSPLDRRIETSSGTVVSAEETAAFCGLVFKVQFEGEVCVHFIRVYSGLLQVGETVGGSRRSEPIKIEEIRRVHASEFDEVEEVRAGDVAAIVTDVELSTGETLFSQGVPAILERVQFPEPVLTARIEVIRAEDFEAMAGAARRLAREDPTLVLSRDEDSGGLLVSGMGELHLSVFGQRLQVELGHDIRLSAPTVLTQQTVAGPGEAHAECRRHLDGEQISAAIGLRVEPFPGTGPATVGRIEADS
ncbi:MAG: translation factor GTPase family protein, partial [Planctomycetota bacterium]|nr:translation factor GTPase family protein [Planctomycetota bacterium]